MIYYTVYKVTNMINGKFYIGTHKTRDLNDNYMGSGKHLNYAQEKYGIKNFQKEILFVFNTPGEMYAKEAEIVNKEFVAEENTYNLKVGGHGGWDHVNGVLSWEQRFGNIDRKQRSLSAKKLYKDGKLDRFIKAGKENLCKMHRNGTLSYANFKGRKHSNETKSKMSKLAKGRTTGVRNSQYGTCWVYHLDYKVSKKVKIEDLENYILDGWHKGRKMKFY